MLQLLPRVSAASRDSSRISALEDKQHIRDSTATSSQSKYTAAKGKKVQPDEDPDDSASDGDKVL